jgi:hypothetical protein
MIILIMVAIIHFFVGSIEVIIPVFSSQLAGSGAKNLGCIQTFFGLGTVLTALMIGFYNIRFSTQARFLQLAIGHHRGFLNAVERSFLSQLPPH